MHLGELVQLILARRRGDPGEGVEELTEERGRVFDAVRHDAGQCSCGRVERQDGWQDLGHDARRVVQMVVCMFVCSLVC